MKIYNFESLFLSISQEYKNLDYLQKVIAKSTNKYPYILTKSILPSFLDRRQHRPATLREFQIFHVARHGLHPRAGQLRASGLLCN